MENVDTKEFTIQNLLIELVDRNDLLYKIGEESELYIYEIENDDAPIYKGYVRWFIEELMEHLEVENSEDSYVIKKYNL